MKLSARGNVSCVDNCSVLGVVATRSHKDPDIDPLEDELDVISSIKRIGHDMPTTNPHGTAHRTRHTHQTLPPNSPDTGQS